MNKSGTSFFLPSLTIVITTAALICFSTQKAVAQDDNSTDLDRNTDSLLNTIYRHLDEELGTSIFTNDSLFDVDANDSTDEDSPVSRSSHQDFIFPSTTNPYQLTEVLRNNTIAYNPWEHITNPLLVRYNRVEGLFLGLTDPAQYYWKDRHITMFGSLGYGFAEHEWRCNGGASEQFGFGKHIFEVGAEGHRLTDTEDRWRVDEGENSISAVFTRFDYQDYFQREGFSIWTGYYLKPGSTAFQVRLAFLNDNYNSLLASTNWAVFKTIDFFRPNPAIDDGKMKSFALNLDIQHLGSEKIFTVGWSASGSAEFAGNFTPSDFSFNRYEFDLRRYQPISSLENIDVRVRAGSSLGDLPLQKIYALGGISTLPAYSYKEFDGNRMLLANAEYLMSGRMLDVVPFFPSFLVRDATFVVFTDAGYTSQSPDNASPVDGFSGVSMRNLKSDWGVAIGTRDAKVRLGLAWRMDVAQSPNVFLRMERGF
jgi:hypothetical protein